MRRKPAVAGLFYPGDREQLLWWLKENLDLTPPKLYNAKGIMVPHAGYIYSGRTAAEVYRRLDSVQVAIIMGPNHTGLGPKASIMTEGVWETPIGSVEIDRALSQEILEKSKVLEPDYIAHLREHSVEVQLPFLQFLNPTVKMVPMVFFPISFKEILDIAGAIAEAVSDKAGVVVVASSDMSHYVPSNIAQEKDFIAIEKILSLDGKGLLDVVQREDISMCGYIPTAIMIEASKLLGATKADLIHYSHSGMVTGEEPVVGYAGIIVY